MSRIRNVKARQIIGSRGNLRSRLRCSWRVVRMGGRRSRPGPRPARGSVELRDGDRSGGWGKASPGGDEREQDHCPSPVGMEALDQAAVRSRNDHVGQDEDQGKLGERHSRRLVGGGQGGGE